MSWRPWSHTRLWLSRQTMSALEEWGKLMCHHDYLGPEPCAFLKVTKELSCPQGQIGSLSQRPRERKAMRNSLTESFLVGTVGRAGSHHRLRTLPESGMIQSHCALGIILSTHPAPTMSPRGKTGRKTQTQTST